ncbi:MAG: hypothetical protein AAGA23_05180 [Pseudomonadota bacterium]
MHNQLLFCLVFLCQILLISGWMARKSVMNMRSLHLSFPPTEYPRMYPFPPAHYERVQRRFMVASAMAGVVGIVILVYLLNTPRDGSWDHAIATGYGLLQYLPLVLWEFSRRAELQMMRDTATTRRAQLVPRRMLDVLPRKLLGLALLVYLSLFPFVVYVNQFDYPWFGGYLNLVIISGMNVGFFVMLFLQVHGKKLDPYQDGQDRQRHLQELARLLLLVSIAATLFAMLTVSLRVFDLTHLKGVSHSLYFQLLALLAFPTYHQRNLDYDVYKDGSQAASA